MMKDIHALIAELLKYGKINNIYDALDEVYIRNSLLSILSLESYEYNGEYQGDVRAINEILDDITDYAMDKGLLEGETITFRDLFDTKIMGALTPMPSVFK